MLHAIPHIRRAKHPVIPKKYAHGALFYYRGKSYVLRIVSQSSKPFVFRKGFFVSQTHIHNVRTLLVEWYRNQAQRIISKRVQLLARKHHLSYRAVFISNAKHRWGSCGANKKLYFSWHLMMVPPPQLDYVIIHELAHLRFDNHSPQFWNFVHHLMPGYKAKRQLLRHNERLYAL